MLTSSFVPNSARPSSNSKTPRTGLPLTTRFTLGTEITAEQRAFLDEHGFLVFAGVAKRHELDAILAEISRLEQTWIAEQRESVYGIPLFVGRNEGKPFLQRFPFTSVFSDTIRDFVRDDRFLPVRRLIGAETRVGDREKDGVVFNRYVRVPGSVYPQLGWHTDGIRDVFYGRMPKQMLNIGMHFDRCTRETGGLRLIPGSHLQGLLGMTIGKRYYDNTPDPREIAVETEPGDLTVHDGRLWHRVEGSPFTGEKSLRRSMYVPYLTDEYQPKGEQSSTPLYHKLGVLLRKAKLAIQS
jgi:ectoine hydroxylase-related dioxygenase (phytanoyl-CoA dioxygenase family)